MTAEPADPLRALLDAGSAGDTAAMTQLVQRTDLLTTVHRAEAG